MTVFKKSRWYIRAIRHKGGISFALLILLMIGVAIPVPASAGWIDQLIAGIVCVTSPTCMFLQIFKFIFSAVAHLFIIANWLVMEILLLIIEEVMIPINNGITASQFVTAGINITRSVVNVGFVIGLIAIALGTIVGSNTYSAKSLLKKFVVGAVLVNFSFAMILY